MQTHNVWVTVDDRLFNVRLNPKGRPTTVSEWRRSRYRDRHELVSYKSSAHAAPRPGSVYGRILQEVRETCGV